jgi:hypothetical protein
MKTEKKKPVKKKPNPSFKLGQTVIKNLLKPENTLYPRELKVFYELFDGYPNKDFWISVDLDFKLNSLAFFNTDKGIEMLEDQWKVFNFVPFEEKPEIKLDNFKHGEDKEIKKKPRNFKEMYELSEY